MNSQFKVGLVVDGEFAAQHIHNLLVWAQQQKNLRISHLIVDDRCMAGKQRRLVPEWLGRAFAARPSKLLRRVLWALINRCEAYKLGRRAELAATLDLHHIGDLVEERICIASIASRSGRVHRFREADLDRIRHEKFDLLIHGGHAILRGGILTASRLGVLSLCHGDDRHYRGGPAGFWEVWRRDPRTGFSLQMMTEVLAGGSVLARGHFPTQPYYLANAKILQERANQQLKRVLLRIAATGELPPSEAPVPYSSPVYKSPDAGQLLRYVWMQASRSLKELWSRQVGVRDRWHVAYSATRWRDTVLSQGIRIADPPGRFLADPFVFDSGEAVYCYVEDYSFKTGIGRISAYEIGESGSRYLGPAIEEPFHLSFPFLFRFDGNLYMCPETAQAGEIRVYRCKSLPLGWELAAVLMTGVSVADTMLFEAGGRWWMLANIDSSRVGDRCSELHLFFSDSPLSRQWTPHAMNPLIVDSGRARNGGLIRENGRIFRVAQIQGGADQYGIGAQVFEITHVDPARYEEALACTLTPSFGPGILGIHHMHADGRYTAWDFRTRERVA